MTGLFGLTLTDPKVNIRLIYMIDNYHIPENFFAARVLTKVFGTYSRLNTCDQNNQNTVKLFFHL
jgi:hypothetical protein